MSGAFQKVVSFALALCIHGSTKRPLPSPAPARSAVQDAAPPPAAAEEEDTAASAADGEGLRFTGIAPTAGGVELRLAWPPSAAPSRADVFAARELAPTGWEVAARLDESRVILDDEYTCA